MSNLENFTAEFRSFVGEYDFARKKETWLHHAERFRDLWSNQILKGLGNRDVHDELVFMLDAKARGSRKTDEAVANTYIRYPTWYRMFEDLHNQTDLRELLDKIFHENDEQKAIALINRLAERNKNNKNGLTGDSCVILNALLFLNNPEMHVSSVSLRHRFDIINFFGWNDCLPGHDLSFGEKSVLTNRIILAQFKPMLATVDAALDPFIIPRLISDFIYSPSIRPRIWMNPPDRSEDEEEEPALEEQRFHLEKYLEHFLYTNWEATALGEKYEIIVENGEPVSLQYQTDVGNIDLLVREKNTGDYLVVELKRGQTSDQTIGQIARYMGWVKHWLAGDKNVKGLIIAAAHDKRMEYSLKVVNDIELCVYKVDFSLEKMHFA